MNKLRRSLYATGILIVAAFIALSCWFGFTVYSQGARWTGSQYNQRVANAKKDARLGDIYDRYGVVLATTGDDGRRLYNSDEATRRAVSQTVGDQLSMSGTGVESYHSDILTGFSGSLVDRVSAALTGKTYSGDDITLTIDANLSRYIASVFPSGYEGAVCLINYRTGEILAMVSFPNYDPQALLDTRLYTSEGSSYFNRCLQGQYTPGSVFKIVTLAGALERIPNITARAFHCDASQVFGSTTVTCQSGTLAHGDMGLQAAFTNSCNVAFASIACELGAGPLVETAKAFAFEDQFAFPDITLYRSTFSSSLSSMAELAWTGVGQGTTTVTPLHMAMIAGAIANRGVMMEPELIARVESAGGVIKQRAVPTEYRRVCSEDTAGTILKYMYKTVASGTARRASVDGHIVCGKTGSAEVSGDKDAATNAWFVGFLAEEEYPYAVSVVIEQGGAGGGRASSLASSALKRAIDYADARRAQG